MIQLFPVVSFSKVLVRGQNFFGMQLSLSAEHDILALVLYLKIFLGEILWALIDAAI